MTHELVSGLAEAVREYVEQQLAPVQQELTALKSQLAELQQRPVGAKYLGVWQRSLDYHRHDLVTHEGSVWACLANHVRSRPDQDPASWQLCVKAGRDGKDLR